MAGKSKLSTEAQVVAYMLGVMNSGRAPAPRRDQMALALLRHVEHRGAGLRQTVTRDVTTKPAKVDAPGKKAQAQADGLHEARTGKWAALVKPIGSANRDAA